MTIDRHSDIEKKGTFIGAFSKKDAEDDGRESGRASITSNRWGSPIVQLQPIYDFKTVDELHPETFLQLGL
jgi:hypothetical protein